MIGLYDLGCEGEAGDEAGVFLTCFVSPKLCFFGLALLLTLVALTWFQQALGRVSPFCLRSTPGLPPCLLCRCCSWLPAVFGPLVLEVQEEATSLQLSLLPSPGDVGSFVVKLVEGLQGQTWASDWAEELRQADRQKEQTFK